MPCPNAAVVVPISRLDRAAFDAIAFARAISDDVRAVHVVDDRASVNEMQRRWLEWGGPVKLVILESPYRALMAPLLAYIDAIDAKDPARRSTVVLGEFVPRHWWEYPLHNQTALRLKFRLFFRPNTVVIDVPYHLRSASGIRGPEQSLSSLAIITAAPRGSSTTTAVSVRAPRGVAVDVVAVLLPSGPEALTFLANGRASADRDRAIRQVNRHIRLGLEVEPPCGLRCGPAVHGKGDEVRSILEVAEDRGPLVAGAATGGVEAHGPPLSGLRRPEAEPTGREAVDRAVDDPEATHDPTGRQEWRLRVSHRNLVHRAAWPGSPIPVALASARRARRNPS